MTKDDGTPGHRRNTGAIEVFPPEPWERQDGEHGARFAAFLVYRDQPLGNRSLREAARTLQRNPRLLQKWSAEDSWQHRVAAWDRHNERVKAAAADEAIGELARRHALELEAVRHGLTGPLAAFLSRMQRTTQEDWDALPLLELGALAVRCGRAFPQVIASDRLVHGFSTEAVDVSVSPDDLAVAKLAIAAEQLPREEQERYLGLDVNGNGDGPG